MNIATNPVMAAAVKAAHARLAPSGADGWMTCNGKIAMEDGEPDDTSEYADEGTAAHALGSMCLKDGSHPAGYIGRVLEVVNGVYWPGAPAPKPPKLRGHDEDIEREFEVDVDFAGAVNTYVQRIKEYKADGTMFVEQELPIDHITGEADATGTGDVVIITADHTELQAHDLKFGQGVKVFAEKNRQLMTYLLGAYKKFHDGRITRFRAVIHQPRLNHLDEWSCSLAELMAFADEAGARAKDALRALEFKANWMGKADKVDAYLQPSEKACQWCKAKAKCPALDKFVEGSVGAEFEVISSPNNWNGFDGAFVASLVPTDLDALGLKLKCVDLIEDWCKAIRAKVESALIEYANAPDAIGALGFKLVQGRKGRRAWTDEAAAEALLKKMRLKNAEMYKFTLITPTKADAFFKATPKRWPAVDALIKQADGKPSVAPANDNRPALVLKPVADDFAVLATSLPGGSVTSVAMEVEGADLV